MTEKYYSNSTQAKKRKKQNENSTIGIYSKTTGGASVFNDC